MLSIFEKNCQILKNRYKDLKVPNINLDEIFSIEYTKDNNITLRINKDGKYNYVHSKYNPMQEALRVTEKIEIDPDSTICFYGIGLLYYIKTLKKEYIERSTILLIEPEWEIFLLALQHIDMTDVLQRENIHFIINEDYNELKNLVKKYINPQWLEKNIIIELPIYKKLYPDHHNTFADIYRQIIVDTKIMHDTKNDLGKILQVNLFKNMKYMLNSSRVEYFRNIWFRKPAILVSSGPSLDKNVDLLKEISGKAIIICSWTAEKKLKRHGIKADIVVTIDPRQTMWAKTEKQIDNLNNYIKNMDIPLLYGVSSNTNVIRLHEHEKILCSIAETDYINHLPHSNIDSIIMNTGGTVALLGLSFACVIGANPIILVGQDLAFTDGKARWVSSERSRDKYKAELEDKGNIYVEDVNGGQVLTSPQLNIFKSKFEEFIRVNEDHMYIDATEGGAKIDGTVVMPLAEVIKKYGGLQSGSTALMHDYFKQSRIFKTNKDKYSFLRILKESEMFIEEKYEAAQEGANICLLNHLQNEHIIRIEKLYKELSQNYFASCILGGDILEEKRITKSKDYFEHWVEMADLVKPLIKNTINEIEDILMEGKNG